ncbi:BZ3500_MvSof-1268-A1-R1_Chr12-2g03923 [Microbotryum saponariae]|uniref:BZ3500_MvSof-1268-A1-R1_Chr12-2g03923 protein n=1 Tax=Microbotryum saponariae TaxID=289078 RepID=A0A2X0MRD8_9BASI|nr:BZ3500_MvSof-1268-A1-R1_Chr12-2g03923 [Microbotryum saponariae]SCZ99763.1 BZ3501_MvSof-1269-A2-R1_Chr12-2g03465 [Microbotryum saponariae]
MCTVRQSVHILLAAAVLMFHRPSRVSRMTPAVRNLSLVAMDSLAHQHSTLQIGFPSCPLSNTAPLRASMARLEFGSVASQCARPVLRPANREQIARPRPHRLATSRPGSTCHAVLPRNPLRNDPARAVTRIPSDLRSQLNKIHYLDRLAPPTRCPPSNEGVTYGTHLASHMALGLLCAGSGQYTLGTSNTAVAALGSTWHPRLPTHTRKVFGTWNHVRLHGIWLSDPTEAQALSLYLVHHHAPSFSVLKQLSRVARTVREIVGLRLRTMGKRLEERTGTPSWSDDFGKSLLEAWQ